MVWTFLLQVDAEVAEWLSRCLLKYLDKGFHPRRSKLTRKVTRNGLVSRVFEQAYWKKRESGRLIAETLLSFFHLTVRCVQSDVSQMLVSS